MTRRFFKSQNNYFSQNKVYNNKKDKRYNNFKNNNRQSSSIPGKYIALLNVKWPNPSVLSNNILLSNSLDVFNYSEKIDGLHTFLLIFKKKIYDVTKNEDLSSIKKLDISKFNNMNFEGDCIIETEFYNEIYHIFDVYYLNGVDYSEKYLHERIEAIEPFLQDLGSSFRLKKFNKIPDLNFLLDYIKNDKSPEGNDIDGVILQRIDRPYFVVNQNYNSYKLKPLHLNTIDFLLKYNYQNKKFSLYLSGNYFSDYFHNFKNAPVRKHVYELNDPTNLLNKDDLMYFEEKILIYFDNPFYPNLGEFEIDKNWNKEDYTPKYIKIIGELIDEISKCPSSYDNKIVELSLTKDKKWVPVKVRNDKNKPNSYRVGLNNISIIFDPIKPLDSIYFQKNLSMNDEDLNIIHKINQTFRKYIIERYINYYGKYSTVIDLQNLIMPFYYPYL